MERAMVGEQGGEGGGVKLERAMVGERGGEEGGMEGGGVWLGREGPQGGVSVIEGGAPGASSPAGSHGRPLAERERGWHGGSAIEGETWSAGGVSEGRARTCDIGTGRLGWPSVGGDGGGEAGGSGGSDGAGA